MMLNGSYRKVRDYQRQQRLDKYYGMWSYSNIQTSASSVESYQEAGIQDHVIRIAVA